MFLSKNIFMIQIDLFFPKSRDPGHFVDLVQFDRDPAVVAVLTLPPAAHRGEALVMEPLAARSCLKDPVFPFPFGGLIPPVGT